MPKGPDPRKETAARSEVASLLAEGAALFNARQFWHAHEAWERAWHALRAGGESELARYVRGMILATAALENATRGKESGFKRQMAEALHVLRAHAAARVAMPAWEEALVALYLDACRQVDWAAWNARGWAAPVLNLRE